jgi:hypothetical protein
MLVEFMGGPLDGETRHMDPAPTVFLVPQKPTIEWAQPPPYVPYPILYHVYRLGYNHRYWYEGEKIE